MLSVKYIPMQYYDAIIIRFMGDDGSVHNIFVDGGNIVSIRRNAPFTLLGLVVALRQ